MYQFHTTQIHYESTKIILRLFLGYFKQMKILILFIFKNIIEIKKMNFYLILIISLIFSAIEIKANRVRINFVFS